MEKNRTLVCFVCHICHSIVLYNIEQPPVRIYYSNSERASVFLLLFQSVYAVTIVWSVNKIHYKGTFFQVYGLSIPYHIIMYKILFLNHKL